MSRALVTGSSSGLGRALCQALVSQGVSVTGVDRSPQDAEQPVEHITCDLADRDAVDRLCDTLADGDAFDLVVFNAGISATGPFETIEPDDHRRIIATNAEAPMVICARLAASGRLASGGSVAFVSSLSHFTGYPGAASYAASKDAIAVYAKSIRKSFAKRQGVAVSVIYPGPLNTDHAARYAPEGSDASKRMEPDEAARLILGGITKGRRAIFPGRPAFVVALLGRIMPGAATGVLRRTLYDKLKSKP